MSTYVLENSGVHSLKLAAAGAGCALLAGALLAVLLIPRLGAAGAVLVLIGYDALQATVLLRGLRRIPTAAVAS
jgi:hypothetical protein